MVANSPTLPVITCSDRAFDLDLDEVVVWFLRHYIDSVIIGQWHIYIETLFGHKADNPIFNSFLELDRVPERYSHRGNPLIIDRYRPDQAIFFLPLHNLVKRIALLRLKAICWVRLIKEDSRSVVTLGQEGLQKRDQWWEVIF